MRLIWCTVILFHYNIKSLYGESLHGDHPLIEKYHYPGYYSTPMTTFINGTGTEIKPTQQTPDYRVEEKHYVVHKEFFKERERPYRLSPHWKQTQRHPRIENAWQLGCYCCTTYRRTTLLAGCAVLTTRHVLTTANPTDLILRSYGHLSTFEGILGGWYDIDANVYNSSMYYTPSRIHIHPMYRYDYETNASHPIPCMYDLSLWAATYRFYGSAMSWSGAVTCYRTSSGWWEYSSSIPRIGDLSVVVGFQFMKSYARRPLPWYKYGVKTKSYIWPCPKSDWHWFHCVMGEYWGRFGFDSGGSLHMMMEKKTRRIDGFGGMCSFSLKLRAKQTTHYFTVIDTHPVLDFLYDSYLGLLPYNWLDGRFEDTRWAAPVPWWGEHIPHNYVFGWEYKNFKPIPYWRR